MFDEKDRAKFLAEGLRNIATGLVIAGFVLMASTPYLVNSIIILLAGVFVFLSAYRFLKD